MPFWQRLLVKKAIIKPELESNKSAKNKMNFLFGKKINKKKFQLQEKNESINFIATETTIKITITTQKANKKLKKYSHRNNFIKKSYKIEKDQENDNSENER